MSDNDEILNYLEYISQQKRSVSLLSSYLGVSISLEANIQQILQRRRSAQITVPFGVNMSLLPATQVEMHSDLFPRPIQATVVSVDVLHRSAVIGKFSYRSSSQDARKEIRVQPKGELRARITIEKKDERTGKVYDISIQGISLILTSKNLDLTQSYYPDTKVRVSLYLPVSDQTDPINLTLPARVSHIHAINEQGDFRAGFMTFPLEDQKSILRRYIFDRQTAMFGDVSQDTSSPIDPSTS